MDNSLALLIPFLALERTFLGHFKTSTAFALMSTFIIRFAVLEGTVIVHGSPHGRRLGLASSAICIVAAMLCNIIGCHRFLRAQKTLMRNQRIVVGGWDLVTEGLLVGIVGSLGH